MHLTIWVSNNQYNLNIRPAKLVHSLVTGKSLEPNLRFGVELPGMRASTTSS